MSGGGQMVAVHGQDQRITFRQQAKAQVGTFGDDPLITHQALEAFSQGLAGHQGVAGDMKRGRAYHLAHVQTNRRIARHLHRQLPEPGHGILREARIRIVQRPIVQPQLVEQHPAIQAVHFQCLDNPHCPTCRSRSFAHGVFLVDDSRLTANFPRILKWRLWSLAVANDHSRLK